jgi:Heat shock protein
MKPTLILIIFSLVLFFACNRTNPSEKELPTNLLSTQEKIETISFGTPIFKGGGNEPFWSLQIDEAHQITLKSIDNHQFKLTAPITGISRINDANALNIMANLIDGKITVMLLENSCQDNMSDKKYSHGLQVLIKKDNIENPILYKGCGNYLNDYLVNNSWKLESINGKNIVNLGLEKTPTLKINLLENKISGFASCNTFFGNASLKKGKLEFKNIALTKKACKDNIIEPAFVKLLNDHAQKHAITKDGNLLIKSADQTFIFKTENKNQ